MTHVAAHLRTRINTMGIQMDHALNRIKNVCPGRERIDALHRIAASLCDAHLEITPGCDHCDDAERLSSVAVALEIIRTAVRGNHRQEGRR